ncbi:MAG: RES family NAD+ phosphorylase [Deltaproteobacteria bacterium]|nr:RES family NAD+ phosphorylase [Deltaproteobacteria bacterium]
MERKNNDQHFIEKVTWGNINKAFTKPVQLSAQIGDNKLAQEIVEFLNPNKDADYTPLLKKLQNFIKSKNENANYIPYQKIAEFFKSKKFDGIKYRSALGKGYNVVLFDLSSAEQADCSLFDVKNISYSFEPIDRAKYITPFGEDQGDCDDT